MQYVAFDEKNFQIKKEPKKSALLKTINTVFNYLVKIIQRVPRLIYQTSFQSNPLLKWQFGCVSLMLD